MRCIDESISLTSTAKNKIKGSVLKKAEQMKVLISSVVLLICVFVFILRCRIAQVGYKHY